MKISDKFLQYIYSSKPLGKDDFVEMSYPKSERIFKNNFYDNKFRRNIIDKFYKSITKNQICQKLERPSAPRRHRDAAWRLGLFRFYD